MNQKYDVIIIGSGIVGSMAARFLSQYEFSILVIEKEIDVGMCPSAANSAIIHAGFDPKPGTLKAKLNVQGNKMWENIAGELSVPMKKTGSLVAAIGQDEFTKLGELYERGISNGVPGMRLLKREELLNKEPLINPNATGALWAPSAAVIDPFTAVLASAENAAINGVQFLFETKFMGFIAENKKIIGIKTNKGDFFSRWVMNSAGLYSDEVMHSAGVRPDFKILPRKGEYLIFDASAVSLNNVLFQVPSEKGKGILVSTTTHGNVMIGPNSNPAEKKEDHATTGKGIEEVLEGSKKLVPSLQKKDIIAVYAGLRATGNAGKDFIVEIPKETPNFINIAGIESPGLASAPAIARMVIGLLKESGENLKPKVNWTPIRKATPCFHKLSHKEKAGLIKKNPAYGRIVCRCEEITEGEILDSMRSPIPAFTYDGIKRRTWLGTGRCQAGFDYPRVIEIISQELKIPITEVSKKGKDSEFIIRKTKGS
jgi:glycerol-3-phosphate dehydrogenase